MAASKFDWDVVEGILKDFDQGEASLLPALQEIQHRLSHVPRKSLSVVAARLGVPLAQVYSVATFYRALSLEPPRGLVVKVCTGTTCHVCGCQEIWTALQQRFGEEGKLTLRNVNCLGACARGPSMMVGDDCHVGLDAELAVRVVESYLARERDAEDAS